MSHDDDDDDDDDVVDGSLKSLICSSRWSHINRSMKGSHACSAECRIWSRIRSPRSQSFRPM